MKLEKELEEKIKEEIISLLEKGKPNWDIPHTLSAVKWMKKLVKETGADEKIMVTAIYFHDTGYPELEKKYNFEESIAAKNNHAKRGADFAKKFLNELREFSEGDIEEICRLIENHDVHDNIDEDDLNRQLIFEADGLAQLDWEACPPNFDKENCLKWIEKYFEIERPLKLWKTNLGLEKIIELKKKTEVYWDNK
ncbi:MAG: HD domain-containing protein [Parcubacteria group bacterium]